MKITIEKFDYLIIQSGYTSRLLKKWDIHIIDTIKPESDTKAARGDGIFIISQTNRNSSDDSDDSDDELVDVLNSMLFIKDGLWGSGLYKMEDREQDIETVLGILEKNGVDWDGTICFKTDSGIPLLDQYPIIKHMLEEAQYCFGGNMYSITYLEEDGKSVCIIKHDCESG